MAQAVRRNSSAHWKATDLSHHIHPFTDQHALPGQGVRVIVRAEGTYLFDSDDNKLLDAFAGLWCVNVGYGRKEIAQVAYDQMVQLPYYNTFFKTTTPPTAELGKVLADLAPKQLNHVFYGLSGSDANDTICRMVRHYWNVLGKKTKKTIISRQNGYHGSTMASASLGGMKAMHEVGDLPLPGFVHIMQPYWFGQGGDMPPDEFGLKAARALEEKILELGADNCAAFIGEPIQGAGGVIIPPASYWPEIQRICKKYDLLLIADEVICGFGRTGHWFASEYFKIEADFMTMAKGLTSGYLPLSGLMVSDRVFAVIGGDKAGELTHGYTYSGHPACCAVAIENIRIIRDEGLVEKVRDVTGPYLAKRLKELHDHPLVGETRNLGLIGAIELVKDKATRKTFEPLGDVGLICREHCFKSGLVMRATRDTMLISPPLTWTKANVDEFMTLTRKALDLTLADVRKKGLL
ncbi:MAG: aspartate aminotransferase family protein [Dongiaceae bacterium]